MSTSRPIPQRKNSTFHASNPFAEAGTAEKATDEKAADALAAIDRAIATIRARPVPVTRRNPFAQWQMGALDNGYMEVSTPDLRRPANLDDGYMEVSTPASSLDRHYMNVPASALDGRYMDESASALDGRYMDESGPRRPVPAPRRPVPAPRRPVSAVPSDADILEAAASFEAQLARLQQGDAIVVDLDAEVNMMPECKTIVGSRSACESRADCGPYVRAGVERCRRLSGKRLATVNAPPAMTCEEKCFRQSGKKSVPKRVSSKRNSAKTQRCHGVTKTGKRCQNRTVDMYCSMHAK